MSDLVTCAFGSAPEKFAMVRRWIDRHEHVWAGPALDGVRVHIHAVTSDGLDAGVNLDRTDATVLADYAAARGHVDARKLADACKEPQP